MQEKAGDVKTKTSLEAQKEYFAHHLALSFKTGNNEIRKNRRTALLESKCHGNIDWYGDDTRSFK